MKINAKLFLLTFTIVTFVSITTTFIYHTLAQKLLQSQQSKALVNSANDFIFEFQKLTEKMDESFNEIQIIPSDISNSQLDFLFSINSDSTINKTSIWVKKGTKIFTNVKTLKEFLDYNTNLLVKRNNNYGIEYYYGKQINSSLIKQLSEKIRAEIAFVERNVISNYTNNKSNKYFVPFLSRITRELSDKNNFELIHENIDDIDLSATHYKPNFSLITNLNIDFIIFSVSREAAEFKSTMNTVTAIIVVSGIFLTVIFLLLFTTKFRKQLMLISSGVQKIASGNISDRVEILSNDEIGTLGNAFNKMLDEIEQRDKAEKEYSEFISLINKNPSLEQIGEAALNKIISATNVDVGAIYLYDNDNFNPLFVFGLSETHPTFNTESSFYKMARDKREIVDVHFEENHPTIPTGITELKISYIYILPIFYNDEIIGMVELASVNESSIDVKEYLKKIKDQLAIGLANGKSLLALKNLVSDLQKLNNAYEQQNIEIKNKNDELIRLHDELKRRSNELEIQTKKAIESEKLKSQFLANMTHELRTPQNSILGLTELILKDRNTAPQTKERLNVVLRNGKKLLTLIENILEYSKLESGNTDVKYSKILLSEITNEVTSFLQPLFLDSSTKFIIESADNCDIELHTDVKKIEQIIYNLVGNAAKFTSSGYVKLKYEVNDTDLTIIVEDTGPGIPDDDLQIIFDEFRQVDGNIDRQFSGTGLGLTICKRYSELLGGEINVKSEVGNGSRFIVTIPNVVKAVYQLINDSKTNEHDNDTLSALIISDSNEAIILISDYLKSHNINVFKENSSDINFEKLYKAKPDVIILDILLKSNKGWELFYSIKNDKYLKAIPVIIINMDEEANCGLGLNVYKYCALNWDKQSIYKAIEMIEDEQSIKFRKLLFIMNDNKFDKLEEVMLEDNLKVYHENDLNTNFERIKRKDPDLIFVEFSDDKRNIFDILTKLANDPYTKSIPIIAFFGSDIIEDSKKLNNQLIETTLLYQYHPLDVLKIIKDRIELINSSLFIAEEETLSNDGDYEKNEKITQHGEIKILIVDDVIDARFTIGEIVKSLGYKPIYASNGYECLEKMIENPDLILLDIMMPKLDGFQTIKKIREDKRYSNTKVFALTAYAMLSDKEIIEKNGFDGLFTKPINTVQLERKLNQIFNTVA